MYLHIPKPRLEVFKTESLHSGRDTPNITCANESKGKIHSRQCETNRQEATTLDSGRQKI